MSMEVGSAGSEFHVDGRATGKLRGP